MFENYENELKCIKESLDSAKELKIRTEARIEQLNKQRNDILKELEIYGVKPEDLEDEIGKLKKEIENLIEEIGIIIPANSTKSVDS